MIFGKQNTYHRIQIGTLAQREDSVGTHFVLPCILLQELLIFCRSEALRTVLRLHSTAPPLPALVNNF